MPPIALLVCEVDKRKDKAMSTFEFNMRAEGGNYTYVRLDVSLPEKPTKEDYQTLLELDEALQDIAAKYLTEGQAEQD